MRRSLQSRIAPIEDERIREKHKNYNSHNSDKHPYLRQSFWTDSKNSFWSNGMYSEDSQEYFNEFVQRQLSEILRKQK
jgi:hypothetical protein